MESVIFFKPTINPDWLLIKYSPARGARYVYSQFAMTVTMARHTETETAPSKVYIEHE